MEIGSGRAGDASPKGAHAVLRERGHPVGPAIRLVSPGGLGERLQPFVFVDLADVPPGPEGRMRWHPPSGIATLTIIHAGHTEYREATGTHGRLAAGDVEWMAAGRGVWHTAAPIGRERLKGFQIWVALPPDRELDPPASMYLEAERVPISGPARVILGAYGGRQSPIPAPEQVALLDLALEAGASWTFDRPADHDVCWLAAWRGRVSWENESADAGELVVLGGDGPITFEAAAECGFVLGSARGTRSPLHLGSHSVHGSAAALRAGEREIARLAAEMRAAGTLE